MDAVRIHSIAGLDVELPLAGPGGRSFAFIVDWHIRVLLALLWVLAVFALATLNVVTVNTGNGAFQSLLYLPAPLIYVFYHPVVELAMAGQTPGKRYAGVRVVTRAGQPPSIVAILIRNVFRLIDSLPAFYVIGLFTTMLTRDHVRVGDLAAGTVLVYLPRHDRKAAARQQSLARQTRLAPDVADLVCDVLERWDQLDPEVRHQVALKLLTAAGSPAATAASISDDGLRGALAALLDPGQ